MGNTKILLVNSGLNTIKAFRNITGYTFVNVNAAKLHWFNFWAYRAIIILSTGDAELISRYSKKLEDYVREGGILVCFGTQAPDVQWIPFNHWQNELPCTVNPLAIRSDDSNLLFKGIEINLLSFHDFFSHGSLLPPSNSTALVSADNKPVMCLIDKDVAGAALITTLDPDYHLAFGMRSMKITSPAEAEKTRAQATLLLENILNWCLWKSAKTNTGGGCIA